MESFSAKRSTRSPPSPEIKPRMSPARRARETPMMSLNEMRFHSSPVGPIHTPPSVNTPSMSKTTALTGTAALMSANRLCSDAAKLLDDRQFALDDALVAIAHGSFDHADVTP